MIVTVWDVEGQQFVELRAWMRHASRYMTRYVTEEQWQVVLQRN